MRSQRIELSVTLRLVSDSRSTRRKALLIRGSRQRSRFAVLQAMTETQEMHS